MNIPYKTEFKHQMHKAEEESIEKLFPIFYEANKNKVDKGDILYFEDSDATETGFLIDIATNETYIIDIRE